MNNETISKGNNVKPHVHLKHCVKFTFYMQLVYTYYFSNTACINNYFITHIQIHALIQVIHDHKIKTKKFSKNLKNLCQMLVRL